MSDLLHIVKNIQSIQRQNAKSWSPKLTRTFTGILGGKLGLLILHPPTLSKVNREKYYY